MRKGTQLKAMKIELWGIRITHNFNAINQRQGERERVGGSGLVATRHQLLFPSSSTDCQRSTGSSLPACAADKQCGCVVLVPI